MLHLLPTGMQNLAGRAFGQLTPRNIVKTAQGLVWLCDCTCGDTRLVPAKELNAGQTTRCKACARASRTARLLTAAQAARAEGRGLPTTSKWRRNWQAYLLAMNAAQRACYEEILDRRRRRGIPITPLLQAEAVEVTYMDVPATTQIAA